MEIRRNCWIPNQSLTTHRSWQTPGIKTKSSATETQIFQHTVFQLTISKLVLYVGMKSQLFKVAHTSLNTEARASKVELDGQGYPAYMYSPVL